MSNMFNPMDQFQHLSTLYIVGPMTIQNYLTLAHTQERLQELMPDMERLQQEIQAAEEVQNELMQQLKQNKAHLRRVEKSHQKGCVCFFWWEKSC